MRSIIDPILGGAPPGGISLRFDRLLEFWIVVWLSSFLFFRFNRPSVLKRWTWIVFTGLTSIILGIWVLRWIRIDESLFILPLVSPIAMLAILIRRRYPLQPPYFSSLFVLCLCPMVVTAVVMFVHAQKKFGGLSEHEMDWIKVSLGEAKLGYLQGFTERFYLGVFLSVLASLIYSVAYVSSRRRLRGLGQPSS